MSLVLGKGHLKKKGIFSLLRVFDGICFFGVALDEGGEDYEIIEDGVVLEHLDLFWVQLGHYVQRVWNFLDLFVFVVDRLPEVAERKPQVCQLFGVCGSLGQVFREFEVEIIIKRPLQGLIIRNLTATSHIILTLKLINPLTLLRTYEPRKVDEVFLTHIPFLFGSDAVII